MTTLKEIARKADLSVPAVSKILNGRNQEKWKSSRRRAEKVRRIAKELGYHRNEIARAMTTGKTNIIGFITHGTSLDSEFSGKILRGVLETAETTGFLIKLFPVESQDSFAKAARNCIEQHIAGVICHNLPDDGLCVIYEALKMRDIPLAIVDSSLAHNWGIRVVSDDVCGASMAVDHLVELGHRKIVCLSHMPKDGFAILRKKGFTEAMMRHNIAVSDKYMIEDNDILVLEQRLGELLADPAKRPTAVFCNSDNVAMIAMRAAHNNKVAIPEELSVTGFADLLFAPATSPPLTTVKQHFLKMGECTVKKLLEEVNSKETESVNKQIEIKIETELILRNSTAQAPVKN